MTEQHRPVLNPGVMSRLAASMQSIADAWEADVAELRIAEVRLANTNIELNATRLRVTDLEEQLKTSRGENRVLVHRNAYLEANVRTLFEGSHDAKAVLGNLATRAVEVIRDAPSGWKDPEKSPPVKGVDEPPASFRQPAAAIAGPRDSRLPDNEFQQIRQAARQ